MIRHAGASDAPFTLLLEDDVVFGNFFRHNLRSWRLLAQVPAGRAVYASLYNPGRPYLARPPARATTCSSTAASGTRRATRSANS